MAKYRDFVSISSHTLDSIIVEGSCIDGNYRVEIYIHLFRPNQEQLLKIQLYRSLAGIKPAVLHTYNKCI
jgi:hypothetical protein